MNEFEMRGRLSANSADSIPKFQAALIGWFRKNGMGYPWRETRDPYAILVSELMLQQTRVAAVLERKYFERWMKRFPDVETLAVADEADVLKSWEGLGYYNRARNLQKAAKMVCEDFGGEFPREHADILTLPGVGRYTAGAVSSFAFDDRGVIVDGNIARVISRLFAIEDPVDSTGGTGKIWGLADRLTPDGDVRLYNSALMEVGQRICSRTQPCCPVCPVSTWCVAYRRGIVEDFPVKKSKRNITKKLEHAAIAVRDGKILLSRESGSRRKGLWRLPELSRPEATDYEESFRFDYFITRYRVTLVVHILTGPDLRKLEDSEAGEWFAFDGGDELPALGSPYRKAILKFQSDSGFPLDSNE